MKSQKVLHYAKELKKKNPSFAPTYAIMEKLDGWYMYTDFTKDSNTGLYRWELPANDNRFVPSMVWLRNKNVFANAFKQFTANNQEPFRIIWEATIDDAANFYEVNGKFNSKSACENVIVNIHDIVFFNKPSYDFRTRYTILNSMFKECSGYLPHFIRQIPILDIGPHDLAISYAKQIEDKGGEGIVAKAITAPYYPGATNASMFKIKATKSFKLLCIGVHHTIGDKGHPNLNIVLRNTAGKVIEVKVGKFHDVNAMKYNSPIGKIVEIHAMGKTKEGVYREPRFKTIREDKQISDMD